VHISHGFSISYDYIISVQIDKQRNMASLELEARLDNILATAQTETAAIDLFAPLPEREECPVCLQPQPLHDSQVVFMHCCGKEICKGCIYLNTVNKIKDKGRLIDKHEHICAFCRQQAPNNYIKSLRKLMKKNNTQAFMIMAHKYKTGTQVFQSDTKSLEMYIRAAELGHADAYTKIGHYYEQGTAVEQNLSKSLAFYEVAAKKGSLLGHQKLEVFHGEIGNDKKSIEHLKVVASAGDQDSMDALMDYYKEKMLSKEDLTQTLRAFQASSNEMKSKPRDLADDGF